MRVAILANPAARSGARSDAAAGAAALLRAHDAKVRVIAGGSAAQSGTLLRTAVVGGLDAVLVAGGDGTVNLALQEVAGTGIPLGIIPIGTGNDMATLYGMGAFGPEDAARAALAGRTRTADLARLTRADGSTRLFGTVLASGFDARVNDRANAMRWPRGPSRYTIAILIEFATLHGMPFTLEVEGADGTTTRVSEDLVLAAVGNGPSYGGGIPICPGADSGDGLLDVTTVRPAGRLHLLRLLPQVYRGTHTTLPEVSTYRARRVRLDSPGVTAYADGDPAGALPLQIDAVPRAVTVLQPAAQ